jgi:lysozyme
MRGVYLIVGLGALFAVLLAFAKPARAAAVFPPQAPAGRPSRVGSRGVQLIKSFEGFEATPYLDVAGNWTVGFGHLIRSGENFTRITEADGEALLRGDLAAAEAAVSRNVRAPITQAMFDALASWFFNLGEQKIVTGGPNGGPATLLLKLNARDYIGAAEQFASWNKATVGGVLQPVAGLTRRRAAERDLFLADGIPAAMV